MELDSGLILSYELAGTVRLPAPPPAMGPIHVVAVGWQDRPDWQIFLKTIHNVTAQIRLSRLVALRDVRALYGCGFPGAAVSASSAHGVSGRRWTFQVAADVARAVQAIVARELDGKLPSEPGPQTIELPFVDEGVLYVPEAAPVLMRVDAGMTAAESAGYFPPLPGHPIPYRCDSGGHSGCHPKPFCDSSPPSSEGYCY